MVNILFNKLQSLILHRIETIYCNLKGFVKKHISRFGESINHPVFWPALVITLFFIIITIVKRDTIGGFFDKVQLGISTNFRWVFVLVVNFLLVFIIYIAFSKFGNIRLGGAHAKPEFSKYGWFSMLFSAGMGIGLLFWSIAEPVLHYSTPPVGEGETAQSAQVAMTYTFMHWGIHAWAIFALAALALAFFTFNRKLPLTFSSLFYPILGKRIYGPIGHAIDILAVLATLFGLATSLGLGAKQINAGLGYLFKNIESDSVQVQILLITGITLIATISVMTGIKKGIKLLSQINVKVALGFLILMLIVGPTIFIFDSLVQNIGRYLQQIISISFWTEAYGESDWQNTWTIFYWGWWISWAPFVGIFIARISKGRTIREFISGVLIVPTIITFIWISAFGGSALFLELHGETSIAAAVKQNEAVALFVFLKNFPLFPVAAVLGLLLIISFFVTSSDSGSLVVDALTSGGALNPPKVQKVFWALAEGAVAAVLLLGGGLEALQTAAITTGLPFAFVVLLTCFSLHKGLKQYYERIYLKNIVNGSNDAYNKKLNKKEEVKITNK